MVLAVEERADGGCRIGQASVRGQGQLLLLVCAGEGTGVGDG